MIDILSIDEAISHARDVAKRNRGQWKNCPAAFDTRNRITCEQCAEEHEQLAEWLEELKCYKNDNDFSDYADRLHKIAFNSGYNNAIDDFAEKLKSECRIHYVDCDPYFGGITDSILYKDDIEEIAEQLKEGGKNEQS